jgi:hypothetical protein
MLLQGPPYAEDENRLALPVLPCVYCVSGHGEFPAGIFTPMHLHAPSPGPTRQPLFASP